MFILKVKRVQKYIETLDMLKVGNSMIGNGAKIVPLQHHQKVTNGKMQIQNQQEQQKMNRNSTGKMLQPVVVTTNWETFESGVSAKLPFTTSASAVNYSANNASYKRSWEYFV